MIGAQLQRPSSNSGVIGLALQNDKRMLMSNNDADDILITTVVETMRRIDQSIHTMIIGSGPMDVAAKTWVQEMPKLPRKYQFYKVQKISLDITQFSREAQAMFGASLIVHIVMRDDAAAPNGFLQGASAQYTVRKILTSANGHTIVPIAVARYWK